MTSFSEPVRVFCGIGGNEAATPQAFRMLLDSADGFFHRLKVSQVYLTAPQDYTEQPGFYNWCLEGFTQATPSDLLCWAAQIELNAGRKRTIHKGPRVLDIDILLYGGSTLKDPELILPHPRMHERAFVLVPLLELEPNLRHPTSGRYYTDLLLSLPDQGVYSLGIHPYNIKPNGCI